MGETDKHPVITDLRDRLGRVEGAIDDLRETTGNMREMVGDMATKVATSCAAVSREIHQLIHENDQRALQAKSEESTWKIQHALAVQNCNAKGTIAEEAKGIALKALSKAEEARNLAGGMSKPKGARRTEAVSWAAVAMGIIGIITHIIKSNT